MLDRNVKSLPGGKRTIALCFGTSLAIALLITAEALSLSTAVSALWKGAALKQQAGLIALFALCFALRHLVVYLRDGKTDDFSRAACRSLRTQALEALFDAGAATVQLHGTGSVVSTLVEGTNQVQRYLSIIIAKVTDMMVVSVVLSCAIAVLDPISGIICLVMLPCIVFYMRLLGSHAKDQAKLQLGTYRQLANHFTDALRGVATLSVFGAGSTFAETVYERSEQLRLATVRVLRTATLSSLVLDLFRVFALAAAAIMLGFRLMDGSVQLMPALAVLIMVPELFAAVRRYSTDFHANLDGRNQLAAILDIIALTPERSSVAYPPTPTPPTLSIDNLSFSYEAGTDALANIAFDVSGPLKIGIVGESGSGKSTLAHVLAGFSQPYKGAITVNGTRGETLCCESWRKRVAYIPQQPHLFNATLRENVALYAPAASDDEVVRAIHLAGLDETFAQLDNGLDTLLGEGARGLSGGQAQRVALARAFLDSTRDVLVFDEPTAHLDIETELELKRNILDLMEGKVTFFATHRLHWLNDMDLVLVLDDGKLVEAGTPERLLAQGGVLAKLVAETSGEVR